MKPFPSPVPPQLYAKMMRLCLAAGLTTLLTACASGSQQDKPIGIGNDPNTLRRSPCACLTLPNAVTPADLALEQTLEG